MRKCGGFERISDGPPSFFSPMGLTKNVGMTEPKPIPTGFTMDNKAVAMSLPSWENHSAGIRAGLWKKEKARTEKHV